MGTAALPEPLLSAHPPVALRLPCSYNHFPGVAFREARGVGGEGTRGFWGACLILSLLPAKLNPLVPVEQIKLVPGAWLQ